MQCISIPVCVEFIVALTQKINPWTNSNWATHPLKTLWYFTSSKEIFYGLYITTRLNTMYDVVLVDYSLLIMGAPAHFAHGGS